MTNPARRVAVTGATGLVGRHLLALLAGRCAEVRALVGSGDAATRLPAGTDWRILQLAASHQDWSEPLTGVHTLVHLAARAHSAGLPAPAVDDFGVLNALATARLARCAAAAGVTRLVFVSSIKVNGERSPKRPLTESDPPCPEDSYGRSKWEAEQSLARCAAETGMQVVVLRPPIVFGPGVGGNFLALLRMVDRGIPLPLASVRNRRSLIYTGNLAEAIAVCMEHPAASGKTFLVADDECLSTPALVRSIARALGRPARLLPFPVPLLRWAGQAARVQGQIERLTGDLEVGNDLIRATTGWSPRVAIADAMASTAAWYRRCARVEGHQ